MEDILNTHQVFYAKNFYKHSGDIIRDMQKVCKLDCPNGNFSGPEKILNFMREQFINWLNATPEVHKEVGSKVAWEDDPVKAEIWSILISYGCYIPMTNVDGWIKGLPDYNAMAPQYNCYMRGLYDRPFKRTMSIEEKIEKAKEILNTPVLGIIDPLAGKLIDTYNFRKASDILAAFGVESTPGELIDEFWDLYSDIVEYNSKVVEGKEILNNGRYTRYSDHFKLDMCSKFGIHSTVGLETDLCAMKWEIVSDKETSEETFKSDYKELCDKLFEISGMGAPDIVDACSSLDKDIFDVPEHLKTIDGVEEGMRDCLNVMLEHWNGDEYSLFKSKGGDLSINCGSGSFNVSIYNENGKIKLIFALTMLFDCSLYEHELQNYGSCFTSDMHD